MSDVRGRRAVLTEDERNGGAVLLWVVVLGWPVRTAAFEGTDQADGKRRFEFPNLGREYSIARVGESCPMQHLGTLGQHCWETESEAWVEAISCLITGKAVTEEKIRRYGVYMAEAQIREDSDE